MKENSYLNDLQESIKKQKDFLELLQKRQDLITENINQGFYKMTIDLVNAKILFLESENKINMLKKIIKEKEDYFKKFAEEFDKNWANMQKDYTQVIATAKLNARHNPQIAKIVSAINWEGVEQNKQAKLEVYQRLKKMLN